jgi:hypothetical protein
MTFGMFMRSALVAICAIAIAPSGRGDTGSPPPPAVGAVESVVLTKQHATQFRRVVMPGYLAWLASMGAPDNVVNFSFYLLCCRYLPGDRAVFVGLYLDMR